MTSLPSISAAEGSKTVTTTNCAGLPSKSMLYSGIFFPSMFVRWSSAASADCESKDDPICLVLFAIKGKQGASGTYKCNNTHDWRQQIESDDLAFDD